MLDENSIRNHLIRCPKRPAEKKKKKKKTSPRKHGPLTCKYCGATKTNYRVGKPRAPFTQTTVKRHQERCGARKNDKKEYKCPKCGVTCNSHNKPMRNQQQLDAHTKSCTGKRKVANDKTLVCRHCGTKTNAHGHPLENLTQLSGHERMCEANTSTGQKEP
eukprot:TRINITY_DN650_c0_g2_i3.p2 TRINITY_DN650_c0_g2~~TRINITY_DN650_c0_g2_i3.p2  ORF type:complete len:161 (+),score=28.84 TRINITY_DN650_c0_g2_i3:575-1057(+)